MIPSWFVNNYQGKLDFLLLKRKDKKGEVAKRHDPLSITQRLEDNEKAFTAYVKAFKGRCCTCREYGHKKGDRGCRNCSLYQTNWYDIWIYIRAFE